jgi:ribosomal protein L7/L12
MSEDRTHVLRFDVVLTKSGRNKPETMKVIMALTGWGLKQSKDFIDEPPGVVLQAVTHARAMDAIDRLESVGAQAEMQRVLK